MRRKTGFRKGAGFFTLMMVLLCTVLPVHAADRLQDTGDKLVIVIDPGHGGGNEGTLENGHQEKSMTLTTAQAMYQQLSLYEGVEIHMTRTDDRELTLKERAEYAESVGADFLFSIHYNASANHELFGSEVWVSAFAPFNGYGYQFGYELMTDMREYGLLIRGVKTRLGDSGNYYGIIRESETLGIPAVIIEHCHVDESRDEGYCDSVEDLQEFGRMDAEAVARYFGLKSSILGTDYSGYSLASASSTTPVAVTVKDDTKPDICQLQLAEADYGTGLLSLTVTAADYDSVLLYYSYSLDGGQTYSAREPWPRSDALTGSYPDTFTLNLQIPSGTSPTVILRAYNNYDLYTESEPYISQQVFYYGEETPGPDELVESNDPEEAVEVIAPIQPTEMPQQETPELLEPTRWESSEFQEQEVRFRDFLLICLAVVIILFMAVFFSQSVARRKRRRR